MDVHAKLAQMRRMIEEARSMPMSASAVVNRGELLGLVKDLDASLESAFSDANRVVADRDSVVDDGRKAADEIIAEAKNEREHIVSDTEVFRVAKRQADQALEHSRSESEALRQETDHYVDAKLANFEITLERTMEAVKRGRERLAGRSVLDSLTDDEVDKIRLPEHLDS